MNISRFIRLNIKHIAGYFLFSLAAFILFFYLLFPREAIKARILYEIERGTATEIKTGGVEWVFPLGLVFRDIVFTKRIGNTGQPLGRIDRLAIEVPLKSIVSLSPVSTLNANIYGGSAKGLITLRGDNRIVKADWINVDISRVEAIKDIPAQFTGKLSGDLVVRLTGNAPEGQIRFAVKRGNLGKIKVMGIGLPDIPVEEFQGIIDMKGPSLSLKDVYFKNSDMKGTVQGDIQLQSGSGTGNLNLSIRFTVGEKMRKDYQGLLSFLERAKDREGYYTVRIKGDPKKPTVGI